MCTKVELSNDASEANYIVSVSQSKRYLFAFHARKKHQLINVIDIQKEALVSTITCKSTSKEITSLFFCEATSVLFVGKQDGEVESYIASCETQKSQQSPRTSRPVDPSLVSEIGGSWESVHIRDK